MVTFFSQVYFVHYSYAADCCPVRLTNITTDRNRKVQGRAGLQYMATIWIMGKAYQFFQCRGCNMGLQHSLSILRSAALSL